MRVLNWLWFAVNLSAVVVLRVLWNRHELSTPQLFKLSTIPVTFIALAIVCEVLLTRTAGARRRGFEVLNEKRK